MVINHNIASLNANRQMGINKANSNKSMEKLSSGLRINKAGDDAAGLAISEKMRAQVRGLDQASANSQDAISMIQTAEGGLSETHSILQRMRELAVQSSTDTNTDDDRAKIQSEVDELAKEITRISNTTEFNTQNLLAGGLDDTFQVGANKGQNISLSIGKMDAESLGVAGSNVTTTFTNLNTAITSLDTNSENLNGTFLNISKTEATLSGGTVSKSDGGGGAATIADAKLFTGSKDTTFIVKVTNATAGGNITAAEYSKDGGKTWSNATCTDNTGDADIALSDGVILNVVDNAANNANDTFTFTQTAQYLSMQLGSTNTGGTTIGNAVKVYNDQASVTLGDSATDKVATAKFDFATVFTATAAGAYAQTGGTFAAADSDQITQTKIQSQAAVIGANGTVAQNATVEKGINVRTQGAANNAIETINSAITTVSEERSKLGAYQNRLEHTIANLGTSSENLTSAESRIRDVDMAKEMSTFSKNNILAQAAQSMLAQANQQPQQVLQLLQ